MSLDHALDHAARGWHVFPVRERGKTPLVKWTHEATTDPAKITAEFAGRSCNVGIACGPSRLFVVDEDTPGAFADFAASHGVELPQTYTVRTGRGRHYYFAAPHGVDLGNAEGALKGHGLNVRGVGGYVVAAGSTHPDGTRYVAEQPERVPVRCPGWLVDALTGTVDGFATVTAPFTLPDVIKVGQRDVTLFRHACSLRGRGVKISDAARLMREAWQRCEQPPGDRYAWESALTKLDQAWGYALDDAAASTSSEAGGHDVAVQREAEKLRVQRDAKAIVSAETAQTVQIPQVERLDAFLAEPAPSVRYRVERLMPSGGRVLLAAQHKAGKTTLVGNLIAALVDGTPFLGSFAVQQARRVVLIDDELSRAMLHTWLATHGIRNSERVSLLTLKGKMFTFDLLDDATRARWAAAIGSADVLILDCLRPALDALALSEDKDAGRFLVGLDALLAEAGIAECFLVHHMGHVGERARGDSRLLDYPDALWRLVVDDKDGRENPSAPRYLSAYGRDVELPETRLHFEPVTRQLTAAGGSRKDAAAEAALPDVIAYLDQHDKAELSQNELTTAVFDSTEHTRSAVRAAVALSVARSIVLVEKGGKHGAHRHYLNPSHRSNGATS